MLQAGVHYIGELLDGNPLHVYMYKIMKRARQKLFVHATAAEPKCQRLFIWSVAHVLPVQR